jgi:N-acetylated-alpha-linked acidic dipeptidase
MDPQTKVSVLERNKSRQVVNAPNSKVRKEILNRDHFVLGALGSGSDYSPFIQHLGIPSLNLGYGGEGNGGEYHSVYDSYDHYIRFKDPAFEYGIALAKTAGRATLRLANAERLPFDFKSFHRTVNNYLKEVSELLDDMREATATQNRMITEKRFLYAADPEKQFRSPEQQEAVPFLDFSSIQNALAKLEVASQQFADSAAGYQVAPENLEKVNALLYKCEQNLLTEKGLPRRPWYRHTIYAPGYYTGYGVKTLPGVREAIEQRNWQEAIEQIDIAARALESYGNTVREAAALIR